MALQNSIPDNQSFLSPLGFKFQIQKLPHVNYFCSSASIPDLTLGQIDTIENTFIKLPTPGDKLTFGLLQLTFRVDEDLKNFTELYDWMIGLGFPDNFEQRANLSQGIQSIDKVYSDGSLILTTASYVPNIEVKFVDLYPVSLGSLDFSVESSDVEYLQGSCTFAYRKYELSVIQ